jgi:hypothetical protein
MRYVTKPILVPESNGSEIMVFELGGGSNKMRDKQRTEYKKLPPTAQKYTALRTFKRKPQNRISI